MPENNSSHPGIPVGFASGSLGGVWTPAPEFTEDLQVQACVIKPDGSGPVALLGCDLTLIWPAQATRLRTAVAARLGTAPGRVALFTTQNHGAPYVATPEAEQALCASLVAAAEAALGNAKPAWCAAVGLTPATPRPICRRLRLAEFGALSFWYGQETTPGSLDGGRLVAAALAAIRDGAAILPKSPPAPEQPPPEGLPSGPLPFRPADDCLLQGIFFRTRDGRPLGAIARWAAHPALATGMTGRPGADYPAYLRRQLARLFGGEAMFLTGPCGDQALATTAKSLALAQDIGARLAELLAAEMAAAGEWKPLRTVNTAAASIRLPLRADIPADAGECAGALAAARLILAGRQSSGAPVAELKRLAERVEALGYWAKGHMHSWTGLDFTDLARGHVEHPGFALRLNDSLLVALPGEPFGWFSAELRRRFGENCLVAEEGNGYLSYLPTSQDFADGGYEVCASPFHPDAAQALMQAAAALGERLVRRPRAY